jgi:hypothetical protein
MITAVELALLLRGSDRDANLDAIADLIDSGLSAFVIEADAVLGMQNTRKGGRVERDDVADCVRITSFASNGVNLLPG